jgi:hypothetical protein
MPRVTIRTGILAPDGREEELSEYLCDWPDCPNIATEVVGCVREFGLSTVMCHEHAATNGAPTTISVRVRGSSS